VVEDAHASLLSGLEEVDRLYILPRKRMRKGWRGWWDVGKELKPRLREVSWDVAIDFQGLWKSLLVARWSGAKKILGYAPSPEYTHWFYSDRVHLPTMDRHAVDRNLDLVAALGASVRPASSRSDFERDFSLPIGPADRQAAAELLASLDLPNGQQLILLNFSARKPANQWGPERFAELARRIRESGKTPILTGGPDDTALEEEIQSRIDFPVRSIVGKCSLLQLAAFMKHMDALVTGDTGPMHIAVSVGLPVVALFGPANPVRTGPYAPSATVLQQPRDCQPCYGKTCKFGHQPPPCLLDIEVEEVVSELERNKAPLPHSLHGIVRV
jgi:ADP-heptose:LPS heptosyltransferase